MQKVVSAGYVSTPRGGKRQTDSKTRISREMKIEVREFDMERWDPAEMEEREAKGLDEVKMKSKTEMDMDTDVD